MESTSFYVAFGLTKGVARSYFQSEDLESVKAWVANDGKRTANTISPQIRGANERAQSNKKREGSPFETLTTKFIRSMDRLNRIIPATMVLLPRLELSQLNRNLYKP